MNRPPSSSKKAVSAIKGFFGSMIYSNTTEHAQDHAEDEEGVDMRPGRGGSVVDNLLGFLKRPMPVEEPAMDHLQRHTPTPRSKIQKHRQEGNASDEVDGADIADVLVVEPPSALPQSADSGPMRERFSTARTHLTNEDIYISAQHGRSSIDEIVCQSFATPKRLDSDASFDSGIPPSPMEDVEQSYYHVGSPRIAIPGGNHRPRRTASPELIVHTPSAASSEDEKGPCINKRLRIEPIYLHAQEGGTTSSINSQLAQSYVSRRTLSASGIIDASSFKDVPKTAAADFLAKIAEQTSHGVKPKCEEFVSAPLSRAPSHNVCIEDIEHAHTMGDEVNGYVLGPEVAEGAFSVIRECARHDGFSFGYPHIVIKIAQRSIATEGTGIWSMCSEHSQTPEEEAAEREECMLREMELWASIQHPNILPLLASFHNTNAYYFVIPYCRGGSVLELMKRSPEGRLGANASRAILRAVTRAVCYLHREAHIVHADIKLENILRIQLLPNEDETGSIFDEMESEPTCCALEESIRLADFGLARRIGASDCEKEMGLPGSIHYCSPERLRSDTGCVDPEADMWSLGVVAYALVQGAFPFDDGFEPRLMSKIIRGSFEWTHPVPPEVRECIEGMLCVDVSKRWTASQALASAWLH